jgi:hypothetical protein
VSERRRVGTAGGGEGMGAIEATCEALAEDMGASCQVVAVCGRNKKLIDRLQARFALSHPSHSAVSLTNFLKLSFSCKGVCAELNPFLRIEGKFKRL